MLSLVTIAQLNQESFEQDLYRSSKFRSHHAAAHQPFPSESTIEPLPQAF